MTTFFIIACPSSYDWDDIDKHINPIIKSRKDVHQIAHWQDADNSAKAFYLLKNTTDKNHMFLLYKDYHKHPQIDIILNSVYNYKERNGLNMNTFLNALVKTKKWNPKDPFPRPRGYVPRPEYKRFFR